MVDIDGQSLSLSDVVRVARDQFPYPSCSSLRIKADVRARLDHIHEYVEQNWFIRDSEPVYGFNTGLGRLKDWKIPQERIRDFQRYLIDAHTAGTGEAFSSDVVRATMLLRVNANARGHSGTRVAVLDRLIAMLVRGVHPVIPQKGSVGASGDLAPLAYLAAALIGHPDAMTAFRGNVLPAPEALRLAGLAPTFEFEGKEALAILNGSTISLAVAVLAHHDAQTCIANADLALAMSLEAMRGDVSPFDVRLHAARPHPGQIVTAQNIRMLLAGSARCTSAARQVRFPDQLQFGTHSSRVQDAYSLRCAPQVHGPVRDALAYIEQILKIEVNSSTDNPLMFPKEDG